MGLEKQLTEAVGRHVTSLMDQPLPGKKSRHTLYLTTDTYKKFDKICRDRARSTSEVLDALLRDFLDLYKSVDDFEPITKASNASTGRCPK